MSEALRHSTLRLVRLLAAGAVLASFAGTADAGGADRGFTPEVFARWVDMRVGKGEPEQGTSHLPANTGNQQAYHHGLLRRP